MARSTLKKEEGISQKAFDSLSVAEKKKVAKALAAREAKRKSEAAKKRIAGTGGNRNQHNADAMTVFKELMRQQR